jgi:hypothetical protein
MYLAEQMVFTPMMKDLRVPDAITTVSSQWQTAIDGSELSLLVPDGYHASPDFCSFKRDKDTSIHVTEDHSTGFPSFRRTIDQKLADLSRSSQDVTLLYRKNFTFNNYSATALYLYDQHRGLTYVYMAFGDEGFHVTMQGSCRADDLDERDLILRSFLTSYYTKDRA